MVHHASSLNPGLISDVSGDAILRTPESTQALGMSQHLTTLYSSLKSWEFASFKLFFKRVRTFDANGFHNTRKEFKSS